MKSSRAVLALLLLLPHPAMAATQEVPTPWYPAKAEERALAADEELGCASMADVALRELGIPATAKEASASANNSMPDATAEDSVAVCDGGLFFDSAQSRLVYLDNVRLNDSRVQLRAAHRLYIQFERQQAADGVKSQSGTKTPATEKTSAKTPVASSPVEPPTENAGKADATEPAVSPPPLEIEAYDAVVDMEDNRLLFVAGPGAERLTFRQGAKLLTLSSDDGATARAMADEEGNVLLEGSRLHLEWEDSRGERGSLDARGGRAFYHASSRTLVLEGPVNFTQSPGYAMQCQGRLNVVLQEEKGATTPERERTTFMGQFAALRFSGVEAASTHSPVQLAAESQKLAASGDDLRYNGLTGEADLSGNPCVLTYAGEFYSGSLQTEGTLSLAANGDVSLSGQRIQGRYVRPGRGKDSRPLHGALSTGGDIVFHADSGTVTSSALQASDEGADIACTGPVELGLAPLSPEERTSHPLPPREKTGMLNLALAGYRGIATVKASGDVRGHLRDTSQPNAPQEGELAASTLDANILTGALRLSGTDEPASLTYRGYSLSGLPAPGETAVVSLLANGDVQADAERVEAAIPGRRGSTRIICSNNATLSRETRELALGPGSRIDAPEAVVTANGPLHAILAPSDTPAKPPSPRYPQLVYAFSGLESATTSQGGTVRSPRGSLQCSQQLSLEMSRNGGNKEMGGIRSALAVGQVAIAGRDAQGRLMKATGDRLTVDGATGEKHLTGTRVVLVDEHNRHEASGAGAAVHLDARNNARITGARHASSATSIRDQVERQKAQEQQQKEN